MEGENLTRIERGLYALLDGLAGELSPTERREVVEFIAVGEYGVALETLSALLVEERKRIPATVYAQLVELAETMGIRASTITEELKRQVIEG